MISIAIVGTGMLVQEVLPMLCGLDEINICAICGTERSSEVVADLADRYSIKSQYTEYSALLKDIHSGKCVADAVYIATPNHLHYDMGLAAIKKGINVFMEKPFASNYEEASYMIETARKKNVFLLEAISNQYLPIYDALREALPRVGDIKYVDCNFSQYSSRFDRFLAGEYFRVFDSKCDGGALMDLNVYNIHAVAGLFGSPSFVNYSSNIMREVDTSGVVTLTYPDFICTCVAAKDCQGPSRILIQGTLGYLIIEAPTNTLAAPLVFYSTKDKTFKELFVPADVHRMVDEFKALDRIISNDDFDECMDRQNETLSVCKILTDAKNTMIEFC